MDSGSPSHRCSRVKTLSLVALISLASLVPTRTPLNKRCVASTFKFFRLADDPGGKHTILAADCPFSPRCCSNLSSGLLYYIEILNPASDSLSGTVPCDAAYYHPVICAYLRAHERATIPRESLSEAISPASRQFSQCPGNSLLGSTSAAFLLLSFLCLPHRNKDFHFI
jgi:hypothetical protein